MQLIFDSVEECVDFVKNKVKGTRGGRNSAADDDNGGATGAQAPAPLQPPAGGVMGGPAMAAPSFVPPQGAFPGPGAATAPVVGPEIMALVGRVVAKIDGALASGQPADTVLNWFRGQCGPEAASATLDQIKTVFLAKLSQPALENIVKLTGG